MFDQCSVSFFPEPNLKSIGLPVVKLRSNSQHEPARFCVTVLFPADDNRNIFLSKLRDGLVSKTKIIFASDKICPIVALV